MEPFALLNLLKTLLPQEEEKPAPPPPQKEDPAEKATTAPSETPPDYQENNAFLAFAKRHDERAKRTKK